MSEEMMTLQGIEAVSPLSLTPSLPEISQAAADSFEYFPQVLFNRQLRVVLDADPVLTELFWGPSRLLAEVRSTKVVKALRVFQGLYSDHISLVDASAERSDTEIPLEEKLSALVREGYALTMLFSHVHPMEMDSGTALKAFLDRIDRLLCLGSVLVLHVPCFDAERQPAQRGKLLRPAYVGQELRARHYRMIQESLSTEHHLGSADVASLDRPEQGPPNPYLGLFVDLLSDWYGDNVYLDSCQERINELQTRAPAEGYLFIYQKMQ